MKSGTDWNAHVRSRPELGMAAAFGTGLLANAASLFLEFVRHSVPSRKP